MRRKGFLGLGFKEAMWLAFVLFAGGAVLVMVITQSKNVDFCQMWTQFIPDIGKAITGCPVD